MRISTALTAFLLMFSATAQDSLNVRHLFQWDDPTVPVGTMMYGNRYNEIWGHAAGGREYAFLGSTLGVHIFDVTEPAASVLVDFVPGRYSGAGVIHRDYKTYAGHLYATCDQGPSSLQIMDLQYLPDSVHLVYDSELLFARAHNIQIDTVNARMYTCGGSTQFSVYSLAVPAQPVLLADLEAQVPWWGGTVGYVHDCFVKDNIVWANNEDAMHVLDMSDPLNPVVLGSLTDYPFAGYNHSGWMNDAGTLYVMADETHGSPLKFVDPTDLSDLEVISTVVPGTHPYSVVHNPFFTGDLVHVAYYYDGYWIWDTSDPLQPALVGYYDMSLVPHQLSYHGAWGVYPFLPSGNILVSDMQSGLWILEIINITGVPEQKATSFRIHPTLTDGPVIIQPLSTVEGMVRIDVLDAAGRTHLSRSVKMDGRQELDLGILNDGLFLIRVSGEGIQYTQRIVKSVVR